MLPTLQGKRAWVFGGTSGIGLASACMLADAGAEVAIAGRDRARLDHALRELPASAQGFAVDANDVATLGAALDAFGAADHLVVSVGGSSAIGAYRQLDEAGLRRTFDGKYFAYQRVTMAALASLRPGGSITWISGAAARTAIPGMSALAASNGALHAMIGPLAKELAPLRVNAVSPGFIDTPYWNSMPPERRTSTYEAMAAIVPAGRVGQPEDVARAVLLVVINEFITGAIIDCDGGRHLGGG